MKAEHRKELHTNALADGMGRLVQRLKAPRQKGSGWLWLLGIVVIALVVGFIFISRSRTQQASSLWLKAELPDRASMQEILTSYSNTNQGYTLRFQVAYITLWDEGIKKMGADYIGAKESILQAKATYSVLAGEVKDQFPILAAEALYNVAVAEESLTVEDPESLDRALTAYEKVVQEYEKTAHGKEAAKRVAVLKNDDSRRHISAFYAKIGHDLEERFPPHVRDQLKAFQQKLKQK